MLQVSSEISEELLPNHNNNNFDEQSSAVGSASTLKGAMTVTKFDEMLGCIRDMKLYAKTIEKDLPDYLHTIGIDMAKETEVTEFKTDDFIQLAKQRAKDNRYILLGDFIRQEKKPPPSQHSTIKTHQKSSVDKQVDYMKRVIAGQPTALEAIYLEALLNPDQWQSDHRLVQASPMDSLTATERKRLNELLYRLE